MKLAYEDRVRALGDALAQRDRELTILAHVASRVHGENEVQAILEIALDEILERMELDTAWIFMGTDEEGTLHLAASRGVSPRYMEEIRTEGLGECLCPEVFWSGHHMQARNTTQCPRMPDIIEGLRAPVAHACIPLRFDRGTRGVLNVAARPGQLFTEDELRFLDTLGHQIGLAVERARHLRAERARNQEARAMAAVSKAIGGTLDAADVMKAVAETAREIVAADRAVILLGEDPRSIRVGHVAGEPHPEFEPGRVIDLVAAGARLLLAALRDRQVYNVDDWESDPRVNTALARRWKIRSGLVVPLVARERLLGLLLLSCAASHHWSDDAVDTAEALAAQASVALENARLFEEARQAYLELRAAQERIIGSEKMAVLGTFASGLAHEVRNPLNSIALQLSILDRRIGRCDPALGKEMAELTAVIREEVRRLDGLVGDFLLFSRTDRIQYQTADLDQLVDEVVHLLRPEARAADVTVRRQRCGDPIPAARMDGEKMKQVVMNLVRNAVEAMPQGGVVTVESGLVEGRARLVVRDTGPGLPEGVDVFQLFVTTKPKGTGLGLSIVQQIVLQHGGEITASTEPGEGARFTVTLPVQPSEAPTEARS
ncbi:MAG TPA: GAF domain-containing protein [Vicinamibacteria bacterium]|nr:GAF domain-containing protein [Vicinamibacteria bacterium]